MISSLALLLFLPLVSTSPLSRRADAVCEQYDTIPAGPYSLLNNLWGEADATYGWQCTTLDALHGNVLKWSTKYEWDGGNSVKSFADAQLNKGLNKRLGEITSMPTRWTWSQSGTGIVSDTAYDTFTSSSPGGSNLNEVMVWLGKYGAKPISYEYDAWGTAVPIASNLGISGHSWNLYVGSNTRNPVYSFVPANGEPITSFVGDLYPFFTYLINNGHISSAEYLVTAQAGTEVTSGTGTFETSTYRLSIH